MRALTVCTIIGSMVHPNFQKLLQEQKALHGWTYAEMRKMTGLSHSTVVLLTSRPSDRTVKLPTMKALSKGLGIPLKVLKDAESGRTPDPLPEPSPEYDTFTGDPQIHRINTWLKQMNPADRDLAEKMVRAITDSAGQRTALFQEVWDKEHADMVEEITGTVIETIRAKRK